MISKLLGAGIAYVDTDGMYLSKVEGWNLKDKKLWFFSEVLRNSPFAAMSKKNFRSEKM